jgi:hypothetical protein
MPLESTKGRKKGEDSSCSLLCWPACGEAAGKGWESSCYGGARKVVLKHLGDDSILRR